MTGQKIVVGYGYCSNYAALRFIKKADLENEGYREYEFIFKKGGTNL